MNWKRAKTLFIFVFILVNISLVIIYVDKVNKSHINDSDDENAVNFKQEEIQIPEHLPSVKDLKMQLLTARHTISVHTLNHILTFLALNLAVHLKARLVMQ